ncbi:hypothetical protein GQ43DRAFT_493935 [Delitschia confertaspora ATCC 74209]|uniref:Uncharacterized protein n=1 Tax=Delitschia confertaspora ATCC 74209 TaxID=1513339 RepID=A0A9P4JHE0_9PLEO|nr:hypothetical protein GQ43DRAFT_493935 [Delitschia confertaspora ATCC 74209]
MSILLRKIGHSFVQLLIFRPLQGYKSYRNGCCNNYGILFMMDVLLQHFKKSLDKYKMIPFFAPRVLISWKAFDEYYLKTDNSLYYLAAKNLHPSRRVGYIKPAWEENSVQLAMQGIKKLWDNIKAREHIGFRHEEPIFKPTDDLEDFDFIVQT